MVRGLRERGVTIILTTHYIEEAEEMADRIGVISKGEIILVEDKAALMRKLGKKQTLHLQAPLDAVPPALADFATGARPATATNSSMTYDTRRRADGHPRLLGELLDSRASRSRICGRKRELARGHLRQPGEGTHELPRDQGHLPFEMARTGRTLLQSVVSPVISTSLYFVVFGAAIGSRMAEIGGVSYGAFIVPGLIMLTMLTQSIANASFGIYFPKFTGTIYELLSAPVSPFETSRLCRRGGDQVGHARR
jgi:hypothetical protein